MKLNIIDKKGEVLFSNNLFSIPLKPSAVEKKCLELFSDNEPCILCIRYAQKSIYFDIDNMLKKSSLKAIGLDLIEDYFDLKENTGLSADCLKSCTLKFE